MKQNFSVNSIALGNMRGRYKQYLMLTIGIVLAIYFVATAFLFASTVFSSLREQHYLRIGKQDVIFFDYKDNSLDELVDEGILSEYGTAWVLGYVLPDGKNEANGFSIAKFDDTALNLAHGDVIEGKLPGKSGEIALERSALARLRTDAGVGDTIQLTFMVPDGAGFMNVPVQKNFILTGILRDKLIYLDPFQGQIPAYADFPTGVLSDEEEITSGGKAVVNGYGVYARNADTAYEHLIEYSNNTLINGKLGTLYNFRDTHYRLFSYNYNSRGDDSILFIPIFFIAIAIVLVMAACLSIINAFSASLEARRRQIGLLRAVGATKKQIRDIFGREALILALFSIPIGLLLACLTVWGITSALGDQFIFRLNLYIITIVTVAGILCVMTAASIPLKKASRIPPLQAIRDAALSRRMKKIRVKSKGLYDVPRHIARRNITLYKNKQATITAMLAISILLMSLLVFGSKPILGELDYNYNSDYVLRKPFWGWDWLMEYEFNQPGMTEQDKSDIAALPMVRTVIGEKNLRVKILLDRITPYLMSSHVSSTGYLSPESWQPKNTLHYEEVRKFAEQEHQTYLNSKEKYGYSQDYYTVNISGTDVERIEELDTFVSDGHINPAKLSSGEEILVIAPSEYIKYELTDETGTRYRVDYRPDRESSNGIIYKNDMFHAGDIITLSLLYSEGPMYDDDWNIRMPDDAKRIDKTVTIGAILELYNGEKDLYSYFQSFIPDTGRILTTTAGLNALGFDVPYNNLGIILSESPDTATEEYLEINLEQIASRTAGVEFRSNIASKRENEQVTYGYLIVVGAIVILFFAITVSMINNALSARIRAGKREIGTIRAVGASEQEITRSYLWQLASMFVWGTAIGMAAQLALCGWLRVDTSTYTKTPLPLPTWQPILFVAVLFGICYLNIRSKVGSIIKDSIVENIREL